MAWHGNASCRPILVFDSNGPSLNDDLAVANGLLSEVYLLLQPAAADAEWEQREAK